MKKLAFLLMMVPVNAYAHPDLAAAHAEATTIHFLTDPFHIAPLTFALLISALILIKNTNE